MLCLSTTPACVTCLTALHVLPALQMWPYRESLFRVCFGRNLEGPSFYIITYLSVALFYGVGMVSGSIWVPIQFVGATAGEQSCTGICMGTLVQGVWWTREGVEYPAAPPSLLGCVRGWHSRDIPPSRPTPAARCRDFKQLTPAFPHPVRLKAKLVRPRKKVPPLVPRICTHLSSGLGVPTQPGSPS